MVFIYSYLVGIKTSILAFAFLLCMCTSSRCSASGCGCAGSPGPSLLAYAIRSKISYVAHWCDCDWLDLFIAAIGDSEKYWDRLNTGDEILYACDLHEGLRWIFFMSMQSSEPSRIF